MALRQDAAKVLKRARTSRKPVIITQRGRAAAALLSVYAYERSLHNPELLRLLARGEKEIETGEGHDLDSFLAEADALLPQDARWGSCLPLELEPGFSQRWIYIWWGNQQTFDARPAFSPDVCEVNLELRNIV